MCNVLYVCVVDTDSVCLFLCITSTDIANPPGNFDSVLIFGFQVLSLRVTKGLLSDFLSFLGLVLIGLL